MTDVLEGQKFVVEVESSSLLRLSGDLDVATVPALRAALEPLATPDRVVALDLAGLTFMDATGVRALCDAARSVGEHGRIVVCDPSPPARRVIEICGLVGTIDISDEPPATLRA